MYIYTYSYMYNYIYINIYIHTPNVQPIAFGVSFNLNLKSQSHWSLFNRTRLIGLSSTERVPSHWSLFNRTCSISLVSLQQNVFHLIGLSSTERGHWSLFNRTCSVEERPMRLRFETLLQKRPSLASLSIVDLVMGWLRWVGCLKIQVSLQNTGLFCRALLQKRPVFLSILLIVATPYLVRRRDQRWKFERHLQSLFPSLIPSLPFLFSYARNRGGWGRGIGKGNREEWLRQTRESVIYNHLIVNDCKWRSLSFVKWL